MVKIESLNLPTGQELSAGKTGKPLKSDLPVQEDGGRIQRTTLIDSIKISIPDIQPGKDISILLSSLLETIKISGGETQALRLLETLFYKGEDPLSFLKDFIHRSGLIYETRIVKDDIKSAEDDLKGLLYKLLEWAGTKSESGKAASELLGDIESRQLLNLKGREEGAIYLQLPMMFSNGPSTADIYLKRDGNRKSGYEQEIYNVGFSIELREAGLFSIYAVVSGNNVSIRMQAEKPEFLEFVNSHIPELAERLEGYGIRTVVSE